LAAWALAALMYPLNTLKVRTQISGTPLSSLSGNAKPVFHGTFRGAVPFVLLNAGLGYSLRPLFSADKLASIRSDVEA